MQIGFDGSRAFTKDRTGTENYSYQLLKALAKIDKKNQYVVYVRPQTVILRNKVTKDLSRMRVPNEYWPQNFQFKIINWPRLWTQGGLALQTFKDKLDVLFVPAHTLPVIRRPDLKTVVTVHDLGSEYLPSMHQVKQRLYLGFMQRFQLQTATKIIAVSKATKADLVERIGVEPEKVDVVYEGYDKSLFKSVKDDALVNTLIHYSLQPKTYYLFVGTVQPRKNLERLIKAFAKWVSSSGRKKPLARPYRSLEDGFVPSVDAVIDKVMHKAAPHFLAGSDFAIPMNFGSNAFGDSLPSLVIAGSKGWLSDEIYKLPRKLGIEDRVKFLGYVSDENLPYLYSGAIALTFPSLFEGFGLPILEAQACGCPVLTSSVSSMPEVAGKSAVFVDPYSVDDIVRGMEEVMNKELRIKLVKSGFENIKRFSWEKCARETLKVLEAL